MFQISDAQTEMPYFSQAQLVSHFAYTEQLRYTYYLKQGRPSFAFVTFLAEELTNGAQTISNKRWESNTIECLLMVFVQQ